MRYDHSNNNLAKYFFATVVTLFLSSFSLDAPAETLSSELLETPDTTASTALPGAIEIEGDKLDIYLDRKMRASGNAVISKGVQKIHGDNIEYDVQNDENF